MSASVEAFMAKAATFVGYKEGPNNNTVFGQWYGLNFNPWCDMGLSYVAAAIGAGDICGRFAYCPSHVNWFRSRGQWGSTPRRGAFVFYSWDGDGVADHVGVVESVNGSTMTTIEFNTSSGNAGSQSNGDGCYRRVRSTTRYVLGFGYPAYSTSANASIPHIPTVTPGRNAPSVSLEHLRASIIRDAPARQGFTSNRSNTLPVEQALVKVGLLPAQYADGSAGTSSFGGGSAYQKWQQRLGFRGKDADGFPPGRLGKDDSFSRLASATGIFTPRA